MATITSSNAVYTLTIPGVLAIPTKLMGFSTDDLFSTAPVKRIETLMGMDGILSAGYVPKEVVQQIVLQANSPSVSIFDQWDAGQQLLGDAYQAGAFITLTSLGKSFTLINGYLTSYMTMADAKKLLQPLTYEITWNTVIPSQI